MSAETVPIGERVASLERGERDTKDDITALVMSVEQMRAQLSRIESKISERRGMDRVSGVLMDGIKVVAGGAVTLWLSHFFQTGPH